MTRQEQIYEATINYLIDKNMLQSVDLQHVETFSVGMATAEALNNVEPGAGYSFFSESMLIGITLLKLEEEDFDAILTPIGFSGGQEKK